MGLYIGTCATTLFYKSAQPVLGEQKIKKFYHLFNMLHIIEVHFCSKHTVQVSKIVLSGVITNSNLLIKSELPTTMFLGYSWA